MISGTFSTLVSCSRVAGKSVPIWLESTSIASTPAIWNCEAVAMDGKRYLLDTNTQRIPCRRFFTSSCSAANLRARAVAGLIKPDIADSRMKA